MQRDAANGEYGTACRTLPTSSLTVDPITLEVIRHGLVSITNQIDANIKRTAFSPYIYEYNDFAVGLTDADGQLIAQCTGGMPPFVADSVGMAVRDGLAIYGRDRLHHGDVVLCNHAAVQGQHLNNTVMYTPIHAGRRPRHLIGFFAINVHWIDIGGAVPRSPDIFGEGLQLRSIKLWKRGEPVEEIYRIIEIQHAPADRAAGRHRGAARRLPARTRSHRRTGRQIWRSRRSGSAVTIILDQSEAAARALIRSMPDGIYTHETFLDNDRAGDEPLPIRIKVIVAGDEMTIDYSDIAGQVKGPINSGWFGGGQTTARVAFKYLMGAGEMANEGTFRPLKLMLPPGKILSADATAPMGNYSTPFPTVIDAVIKALEKALPERVPGGHFGTHSGIRFYGRRPDGSYFGTHDSGHGGWGACATHDGAGPFRTMAHGDTRIIPLELQETYLPVRIEEFALRAGFRRRRENSAAAWASARATACSAPATLQTNLDRTRFPPWGVQGGQEGKARPLHADRGGEPAHRARSRRRRASGWRPAICVCVETGGGGGYGPPRTRTRAASNAISMPAMFPRKRRCATTV